MTLRSQVHQQSEELLLRTKSHKTTALSSNNEFHIHTTIFDNNKRIFISKLGYLVPLCTAVYRQSNVIDSIRLLCSRHEIVAVSLSFVAIRSITTFHSLTPRDMELIVGSCYDSIPRRFFSISPGQIMI